jgi:hypothetical protein
MDILRLNGYTFACKDANGAKGDVKKRQAWQDFGMARKDNYISVSDLPLIILLTKLDK